MTPSINILEVVVDGIDEQVGSRRGARQEGAPRPVVVLGAEMEVAQQHGALHGRNGEDGGDNKQEAEHIVDLRAPGA